MKKEFEDLKKWMEETFVTNDAFMVLVDTVNQNSTRIVENKNIIDKLVQRVVENSSKIDDISAYLKTLPTKEYIDGLFAHLDALYRNDLRHDQEFAAVQSRFERTDEEIQAIRLRLGMA